MITPPQFWALSFAVFLAAFAFILWEERDIRFFFYFMFGSVIAFFVFEVPSISAGYYAYNVQHFLISFYGVPLTISLAEGFCIAIAIYLYESLPWLFGLLRRRWAGSGTRFKKR